MRGGTLPISSGHPDYRQFFTWKAVPHRSQVRDNSVIDIFKKL